MSIVIEQDADAVSAAASFHGRADVDAVCLVGGRIERHPDWSQLKDPIDSNVTGNHVDIRTEFRFRAIDSSASRQEALLIECTFQATYEIDSEYRLKQRS